eukprot:623145-Pyramimonas_sp.AAC.1
MTPSKVFFRFNPSLHERAPSACKRILRHLNHFFAVGARSPPAYEFGLRAEKYQAAWSAPLDYASPLGPPELVFGVNGDELLAQVDLARLDVATLLLEN